MGLFAALGVFAAFCGSAGAQDEGSFSSRKKTPPPMTTFICSDGQPCTAAMKRMELAAEKYLRENPKTPPPANPPAPAPPGSKEPSEVSGPPPSDDSRTAPSPKPPPARSGGPPDESEREEAPGEGEPLSAPSRGASEGEAPVGGGAGGETAPADEAKRATAQTSAASQGVANRLNRLKAAENLFGPAKEDALAGPDEKLGAAPERGGSPPTGTRPGGQSAPGGGSEDLSAAGHFPGAAAAEVGAGTGRRQESRTPDLIVAHQLSRAIPAPGAPRPEMGAPADEGSLEDLEARINKLLERAAAEEERSEMELNRRREALERASRLLASKTRIPRFEGIEGLEAWAEMSGRPLTEGEKSIVASDMRRLGFSPRQAANMIALLQRRKIAVPSPAKPRESFWRRLMSFLKRLIERVRNLFAGEKK